MAPFEVWLASATRGLCDDATARIRQEIGDHFQHSLDFGRSVESAIAALGDPREANRDYRQVFLTQQEALLAPTYTQPKRTLRTISLQLVVFAAVTWLIFRRPPDSPWMWAFWALIWIEVPLRLLLPGTTVRRAHGYLTWSLVRVVVLSAIGFMDAGLPGMVAPLFLLLFTFLDYQRWNIFRKLAGRPAVEVTAHLQATHPSLTRNEAIFLKGLSRGPTPVWGWLPLFLILAVLTYFQPVVVSALMAVMVLRFFVPQVVDVYSPQRNQWFRWAKAALLAASVIWPLLYLWLVPAPGQLESKAIRAGVVGGTVAAALVLASMERQKISLRRKLPSAEWPKELYL